MISKVYCNISHGEERGIIADRIEVAKTFFKRLRGLLGRSKLEEGEGLLLCPCSAVHCFGMRFPIDIIFLNKRFQVIDIRENMMPGSRASNRQARYVLELKSGAIKRNNIQNGEQLVISFHSPLNN